MKVTPGSPPAGPLPPPTGRLSPLLAPNESPHQQIIPLFPSPKRGKMGKRKSSPGRKPRGSF